MPRDSNRQPQSGSEARSTAPEIRAMAPPDARSVARILTDAFDPRGAGLAPGLSAAPAPTSTSQVERWMAGCRAAWVALAPGYGPVGAAFGVVTPQVSWLGGLGVDSRFRGLGVGAALADAALDFLRGQNRSVVGLEAWPHATDALAMYARRGLTAVDLTVRLRVSVGSLPAAPAGAQLERAALPWSGAANELEADIQRTIAGTPLSEAAFVLFDARDRAACFLVCEPEPVPPPAGGALLIRLAWLAPPRSARDVAAAVQAVAAHARDHNFHQLEIDVPLGAGRVVGALRRIGMRPVATMLRLADDPAAYPMVRSAAPFAGRWSL